jgi:hypothetical protein
MRQVGDEVEASTALLDACSLKQNQLDCSTVFAMHLMVSISCALLLKSAESLMHTEPYVCQAHRDRIALSS